MTLEEADLMLVLLTRWVGASMLHREMVVDFALVDGGSGLRDQFRPQHTVIVPDGAVVDGDLDSFVG